MFKVNRLLAIIALFLFVVGMGSCGGGGGGGTSGGENGGGGPQKLESKTETINSTGGNIQLSDGAAATLDSDILKETTSVSFSKYDTPLTSVENAQILSFTYTVEIPANKIADSSGETEDFGLYITIEIPLTQGIASTSRVASSSISNNAYKLSRVIIDYGDGALTLFGSYAESGSKAIVRVAKSSLVLAKQKATEVKVKIETTILSVKNYFGVQPALYQVGSSSEFVEVTSNPYLPGRIPIILIHGWQTLSGLHKGGDVSSLEPHKTVWKNFIDYFFSDDDLKSQFALFSYRYDSDHAIDENAQKFRDKINEVFGSFSEIVLISKSMGGLLSHTYIQRYGGDSKVSKLITLGTPYHGSPLVQAGKGLVNIAELAIELKSGIALPIESFLVLATPGTFDLAWDNFDSNYWILEGNNFLLDLSRSLINTDIYTAFGGVMNPETEYRWMYDGGYRLNKLLRYTENDGVVPLVSAHFRGYSSSSYYSQVNERIETDYDHEQISSGRCDCSTDPLFTDIKTELIALIAPSGTISGSVKDAVTQSPLQGVSINVYSGGSITSTGTTASNGIYSLTVPSGSGYRVEFTKAGYIPAIYYNISVESNATTHLEAVLQIDTAHSGIGNVSGKIVNALDGTGVSGLIIKLRAGINVTTGSIVATAATQSGGFYSFTNLNAGNYTAEVSGSGYNTTFFTVNCIGGTTTANQNATITPILSSGETRIILTWGEIPWDLDSHLTGPLPDGTRFHLYFPYAEANSGSPWPNYVKLDLDDVTSYGPETTTIYQQIGGLYRFSVHDYSNRYSSSSYVLSNSGAQVRVYRGSNLVDTFNVPAYQEGTLWTVFEMSGNTITPINTMSYESSSINVQSISLRRSFKTDAPLMRNLPRKR